MGPHWYQTTRSGFWGMNRSCQAENAQSRASIAEPLHRLVNPCKPTFFLVKELYILSGNSLSSMQAWQWVSVAPFSRGKERFFAPIEGVAEAVEGLGHHPRVQTRAFAVLALGCHRSDHSS